MEVGRYAGAFVDTLPNSYLRWIIAQDFSKEILEAAKKKLEESDYNDIYLNVTRHAIDMFSKRALNLWGESQGNRGDDAIGIGTYVAMLAQDAWDKGLDISKNRHKDDGIIKEYMGIGWVFAVNDNYPDYKELITIIRDD